MKLKNIHNRQDFYKINEFFGNTEGGVGERDGFANNAKLKDTMLGKLLNGIFRGIGWLWRKSKEYFVINRLIASLVNELMRGIILFCFDNNISLTEGKQQNPNEEVHSNEDEEEDYEFEEGDDVSGKISKIFTDDEEKMSKEELEERIQRLTKEMEEDSKKVQDLEGQIRYMENELNSGTLNKQEKIKKQEHIDKLKKELIEQKEGLKVTQEELAKLKQQLQNLGGEKGEETKKVKTGVNTIEQLGIACRNKYNFVPKSEFLPDDPADFEEIGYTSLPEFKKNLKDKKFSAKKIQIGDKFTIIDENGKLQNIKVWDVNNSTGQIWYFDKNSNVGDKPKETTNINLLPFGFPGFKKIKNTCYEFLNRYIAEYETMSDEDKQRMETVYMQYKVIDELSNIRKTALIGEAINYFQQYEMIFEDGAFRNMASKATTSSGTAKFKPDEPKAGKVGLGKSIAMRTVGVSANVGNILTRRDRKKYENNSEDFKINVHDVNLAAIEKTIEELSKSDPTVKAKVSSYVNPYNLKTIQLSAEQLIANSPEGKANTQLKLKWDKEVSNTYAAFTNIMDIEKLNDVSSKLDHSKLDPKVNSLKTIMTNEMDDVKTMVALPIESERSNYNKMKDGYWSYYSFTYGKLYKTSIAPVSSVFNEFGLIGITSCFTSFDSNDNVIVNDTEFNKHFVSTSSDELTTKYKVNVFFLFKKEQRFPDSNKPRTTKVFVLNEYIEDNKSYISLKRVKNGTKNTTISEKFVNYLNSSEYIFDISSMNLHKFETPLKDELKNTFNFIKSNDPRKNTDFRVGLDQPVFLTEDMKKYLKILSSKL